MSNDKLQGFFKRLINTALLRSYAWFARNYGNSFRASPKTYLLNHIAVECQPAYSIPDVTLEKLQFDNAGGLAKFTRIP